MKFQDGNIDSLDYEDLLILLALHNWHKKRKPKKYSQRFLIGKIFAERKEKSVYESIVKEEKLMDEEIFLCYGCLQQNLKNLWKWWLDL